MFWRGSWSQEGWSVQFTIAHFSPLISFKIDWLHNMDLGVSWVPGKSSQPSGCPIPGNARNGNQLKSQNWKQGLLKLGFRSLGPVKFVKSFWINYEAGICLVMRYLVEAYKCLSRDSFEPRHFAGYVFQKVDAYRRKFDFQTFSDNKPLWFFLP